MHRGFDKAWRSKQLSQRVLSKIQELFETGEVDRQTCHFVMTGGAAGPEKLYEPAFWPMLKSSEKPAVKGASEQSQPG